MCNLVAVVLDENLVSVFLRGSRCSNSITHSSGKSNIVDSVDGQAMHRGTQKDLVAFITGLLRRSVRSVGTTVKPVTADAGTKTSSSNLRWVPPSQLMMICLLLDSVFKDTFRKECIPDQY